MVADREQIGKPMKKRVYVKPVTAQTEIFGWLTLELNIIEAFRDDLQRYGLKVALLNWIKTAFFEESFFDKEVEHADQATE